MFIGIWEAAGNNSQSYIKQPGEYFGSVKT
jgi:hypothetical protein